MTLAWDLIKKSSAFYEMGGRFKDMTGSGYGYEPPKPAAPPALYPKQSPTGFMVGKATWRDPNGLVMQRGGTQVGSNPASVGTDYYRGTGNPLSADEQAGVASIHGGRMKNMNTALARTVPATPTYKARPTDTVEKMEALAKNYTANGIQVPEEVRERIEMARTAAANKPVPSSTVAATPKPAPTKVGG